MKGVDGAEEWALDPETRVLRDSTSESGTDVLEKDDPVQVIGKLTGGTGTAAQVVMGTRENDGPGLPPATVRATGVTGPGGGRQGVLTRLGHGGGPPGQQERGGQQQETGERDRLTGSGERGQQAPQGGQGRGGQFARHRPGGEGADHPVRRCHPQPVGGEHRVEDGAGGDHPELDGHHEQQPGRTGADEGQAERPARAQDARGDQDAVPTEAGDQGARHP